MRRHTSVPVTRSLAAAALLAASGACATKGDVRALRGDLRDMALRQDSLIAELRVAALSTRDTLRETSDQIFSFRGDISRQLREISRSLATIEALAGENQRGIAGVRDQLANLRRSSFALPPGGGEAGEGAPGAAPGGGEAEELYNAAVGQFNRGSLSTARTAFDQFLSAHPNHRLAPDARYYLADVLVQENRVRDALAAFQEIPQLYPTAPRVPEALWRVALLQIELDRRTDARATLERILNTYPESDVASLAREKLAEIR